MASPSHGGHAIHEGGIAPVLVKLHLFFSLCFCACWRWRRGHPSYVSLRRPQSDVIQPLGLGSQFVICHLNLTRDVKYAPWPSDWAGQSGSVPTERTAPGVVSVAQRTSQKRNFIFMCPSEACCREVSLRVMGYDDSESVTTRRLSFWCLKTNPLFFCRSLISKSQIMCTLLSWMAPALASWSSACDI